MTRSLAFASAIIATALSAAPAAQGNRDAGSHSSSGAAAAAPAPAAAPTSAPAPAPAPSGGSTAHPGGGRTASGSGQSSGGAGAGTHAVPRGDRDGISLRSDSQPQPAGGTAPTAAGHPASGGRTAPSGSISSASIDPSAVPSSSRPRDGRPATGQAVQRPPSPGIYPPISGGGYYPIYPWGWGGLAFGGYYGGYYDPWFDPGTYPSSYSYGYEGALHLKVKPRQAAVYVDGYYAGEVDEFDGMFQRLHLDSGPHRIEITLDGYEPLYFDVRIAPDNTVTYKAEMKRLTSF
jgi:hypothetical protein